MAQTIYAGILVLILTMTAFAAVDRSDPSNADTTRSTIQDRTESSEMGRGNFDRDQRPPDLETSSRDTIERFEDGDRLERQDGFGDDDALRSQMDFNDSNDIDNTTPDENISRD